MVASVSFQRTAPPQDFKRVRSDDFVPLIQTLFSKLFASDPATPRLFLLDFMVSRVGRVFTRVAGANPGGTRSSFLLAFSAGRRRRAIRLNHASTDLHRGRRGCALGWRCTSFRARRVISLIIRHSEALNEAQVRERKGDLTDNWKIIPNGTHLTV